MPTYRDGSGFLEPGCRGDAPAYDAVEPAGKKPFTFRTGDEFPLGRPPGSSRMGDELPLGRPPRSATVRQPGPAFETSFAARSAVLPSLALRSGSDLVAASRALRLAGVQAWVTVATPTGPQALELTHYLRSRGLE